jgi:hypothetical protein
MVYKKKLHLLNPEKLKGMEVYKTKNKTCTVKINTVRVERSVRELLAKRVSGTMGGLWLLIDEHLRLGSWDLLKIWTGNNGDDKDMRLGLQMIHESAMCVSGIRRKKNFCNQGFELLNGLPNIATDKEIHWLLDKHTVYESERLQEALGKIRYSRGDYKGRILAIDPHRIRSHSRRVMPKKKSKDKSLAEKILQTFFCADTETRQPIFFKIGTSSQTVSRATRELLKVVREIIPEDSIFLADNEHFTESLIREFVEDKKYNIVIPLPSTNKVYNIVTKLKYKKYWAGYSIGEGRYKFNDSSLDTRLIAQRCGEKSSEYTYKAFIFTGKDSAVKMLTEAYPDRWSIEEFFNFEGDLGWRKASTLNLNIRYGKMSLALIAQALIYGLRKKLPKPSTQWTSEHLANSLFHAIDSDIRVKDDTIIVTMYNFPEILNLKRYYENLPSILERENVDPRIPWLYNFKINFRFK